MNFYETKMGRRFFDAQLPQLIGALEDIAKAKTQPVPVVRLPDSWLEQTGTLEELFSGRYQPEAIEYNRDDPLNRDAMDAMKALLNTLSPQQRELFDAYEAAENDRGSDISLRAFRAGVRLAVQIGLAGCRPLADSPFRSAEVQKP